MDTPQIEVQFGRSVPAGPGSQRWRVTWRAANRSPEPVQLLNAWLPHSRFRSDERDLAALPALAAGEVAQFELEAAGHEDPGTAVPAAFLILRFLWRQDPWRLLVRTTVTWDDTGVPFARIERIATQRVGFSR